MEQNQEPKGSRPTFGEFGTTGLNHYGGSIFEEFIPALTGPRAIKVYQEMSTNDPTIGAILLASEQMIRKASWTIEGPDPKANTFVESCLGDMSSSWTDTIAEILSMLVYGWSYHELVYKIRRGYSRNPKLNSQYNDGLIGWRKIPGRAQNTLFQWEIADDGDTLAMLQQAPPKFEIVRIPIEKALLFRTKADKNNPEGRSMLRNAYRPWYFKKRIEEIEGIGIERDLAGLPVLTPPDGIDLWNNADPEIVALRGKAEKLVTNIRRDQHEGVILPFGWTLNLLSSSSKRQFDTNAILNRYDQRIAITVLADMVLLGADKVGSFALAKEKKNLFTSALEAWCDTIAGTFNRYAIPRLMELNRSAFPNFEEIGCPKLVHGEVDNPTLDELASYITTLSNAGMPLFPDINLENHLRKVASMPKRPEGGEIDGGPVAKKPTEPTEPTEPTKPEPGAGGSGEPDPEGDV